MKFYYLILFIVFIKCSINKEVEYKDAENHYFYFDSEKKGMNYIYSAQNNDKKFFYIIENANPIFFKAEKRKNDFIERKIKPKDTVGNKIKKYDWLNKLDNFSKYEFFNTKPKKDFYIIRKNNEDSSLQMIKVRFIDEIS